MRRFLDELTRQRWDDHRLYHHSRVNQSLHLLSALSFLTSYALLLFWHDPVGAALVGWPVAMIMRQIGHFFFEPKGYDEVNQATFEEKEAVKVGYNLQRKVVLLSVWAMTPFAAWQWPELGGLLPTGTSFLYALSVLWIVLGAAAVLFRTVQLFVQQSVLTGTAWATKILTDPVHDVYLYHRAPLALLRGQWIDPMEHARHA